MLLANSYDLHKKFYIPVVLALSESRVLNNLDLDQFSYRGYNFEPAFFPHRGIYLKSNSACKRFQHFEARSNEQFGS